MAGTLTVVLVIGLVLAVGSGLYVKQARRKVSEHYADRADGLGESWEGPAAIGSIVALVGISAAVFAVLALFGMLLRG